MHRHAQCAHGTCTAAPWRQDHAARDRSNGQKPCWCYMQRAHRNVRAPRSSRRVSPTPETPAQSRASSRWRTCRPRTPYLVLTHHAPDPRRTFNTANPNPSNSEHRTLHVECGYVKTGRKIAACLWRFCLKIRKYGYGRERWSGCVWDARNAMSS